MHVLILSRKASLYSTRRLYEAAEKRAKYEARKARKFGGAP